MVFRLSKWKIHFIVTFEAKKNPNKTFSEVATLIISCKANGNDTNSYACISVKKKKEVFDQIVISICQAITI